VRLKVTLVRPHYFSVWESLSCGYIASYLKKYYEGDLEINFFDGFFDSDKDTIEGSVNSEYVAFSCTSPQMKHALALARGIKNQNSKIVTVFGGHHPSSLPWQTSRLSEVDIVVAGEGETGMLSALNLKGKVVILGERGIQDLDSIPFPDRKLIRQDRTLALTEKNDGERIASVLSGRGCPFSCIFCTGDHNVFGSLTRKRSVNNVLDEIQELVNEWHIDFCKFADAEINSKPNWVRDFCKQKYLRRITVPFGSNVHARLMDKATMELMKSANCREIWVGVESGSPRILKEMRKEVTIKQIENVFRWAKETEIRTRAYFMVGFPSENRQDFKQTLELAERLDADVYGMTILCPYPGTALYNATQHSSIDWSVADEYHNDFWRTENFTNEELKSMQAEFVEKFKDRLTFRHRVDRGE